MLAAVIAQVTNDNSVTWVGLVSGGLPVAAAAAIALNVVWKRLNEALDKIDQLQKERLADVRELAPLVRDMGGALVRATLILEREVTSNKAGGE